MEINKIEKNLLSLLESGVRENVLLAFQLQESIQSSLFVKRIQVYKAIAPLLFRRYNVQYSV